MRRIAEGEEKEMKKLLVGRLFNRPGGSSPDGAEREDLQEQLSNAGVCFAPDMKWLGGGFCFL